MGLSIDTGTDPPPTDLVCLSHLRWEFVFQRPQHLMTRQVRSRRVFFVEEPRYAEAITPRMERSATASGVEVVVPWLPHGLSATEAEQRQRGLLDALLREAHIDDFILWYYTPMALAVTDHLPARLVVYDCMDELSLFKGAPPELLGRERRLLARADVVFTGGWSLYEAKRERHPNVHGVPSSVDVSHFAAARRPRPDPPDQAPLGRPRLGFFGVIDERFDTALVDGVARARPDWQLVVLGPVVKIDPATLPRRGNIHYLGGKSYDELPAYLAGWDVALLPFARNDSTRFISPTKTPEYLAAGRPVVSTSIRDVVRPYGERGLVRIADDVAGFVAAAEAAMREDGGNPRWLARVDRMLSDMSWDRTWAEMSAQMEAALRRGRTPGTDRALRLE
jgi:glycosyltransferase involved in cell wall biosynthesis